MARRCDLTDTAYLRGHTVSHSNRKAIKRSQPNLQTKRIWSEREQRFVRLRLTTRAIRTIDLLGLDAALAQTR
jgi:large subunit ribosomal protein L28